MRNLAARWFSTARSNDRGQARPCAPSSDDVIAPERTPSPTAARSPAASADKRVVKKLFEEIGPKYKDRKGGYLRIIKISGWRKGDGARLAEVIWS